MFFYKCVIFYNLIFTIFCNSMDYELVFIIESSKEACFFQYLPENKEINVEFEVLDGAHGDLDISFYVAEPQGRILVADFKKDSNGHEIKTETSGDFKFCFDNTFSTFNKKIVFFGLSGLGEDVWNNKEQPIEFVNSDLEEYNEFHETVSSLKVQIDKIQNLQTHIKSIEAKDRNIAEEAFFRVNLFSTLVFIIMISDISANFFSIIIISCKGQRYFIGEENPEEFYAQVPYYQQPVQNQQFFHSNKDFQNPSDFSGHQHQPKLPQYHHQEPNIQFPFKENEEDYVIPSTHRPDYSRILSPHHRFQQHANKLEEGINPVNIINNNNNNIPTEHFIKRENDDYYEENLNRTNETADDGNNLGDDEYDDEYYYDDEPQEENYEDNNNNKAPKKKEKYDVLTMKPNVNENYTDFLDTTTQFPATSLILPQKPEEINNDLPEVVVSVVTSKTIVNNTVISPVTTLPLLNLTTTTDPGIMNNNSTTDSWIVIASVQTSRSISGARYIPSSTVDQDERRQLLNEDDAATTTEAMTLETDNNDDVSSTPNAGIIIKTSTESLIDKLDGFQSNLSSVFTNDLINNNSYTIIQENFTTTKLLDNNPTSNKPLLAKRFPGINYATKKSSTSTTTTENPVDKKINFSSILDKIKPINDLSALLPPGYKPPPSSEAAAAEEKNNSKNKDLKISKPLIKIEDNVNRFLPPGYNNNNNNKPSISKSSTTSNNKPAINLKFEDDVSKFLPPGFKSETATKKSANILAFTKSVELPSGLLPSGYNKASSNNKQETSTQASKKKILPITIPETDLDRFLPPGYKGKFNRPKITTTHLPPTVSKTIPGNLLPPGFKLNHTESGIENSSITNMASTSYSSTTESSSSTVKSNSKVVFASRPGGSGSRKSSRTSTTTTSRSAAIDDLNKAPLPTIKKGWPIRASTEFTGWPTPSTTPISIEKILEAVRAAATSSSTSTSTEISSTTSTTTTTTTTPKATTPGICVDECDLAGTIKLIGRATWIPELLDSNTIEYQDLANNVQTELEAIYNNSPELKKWYKKIRIDGFSEGSILVDYLVEFNEIGTKIDTQEIKRLFHESLNSAPNREGKSLNESNRKVSLGQFEVDTKYTDFIVIPKRNYPTVGYADDVLMPQWAIAVIVIGLASLLFVIIFGATVLINRHKNSKKTPVPLTEDMLNELNKNHMGGLENYGADDDFYNMEDVWSDKHYEQKLPKKRHSNNGSSSLYDNSTANLYDSWRSQWNAYNTYYGGNHSQSRSSGGGGFRRPNHDTNF